MAWTSATIATAEQTVRGTGVPYLVGNNILEDYASIPQWRASGNLSSGSDASDYSVYPPYRASDRHGHTTTSPNATVSHEMSLCWTLNTGTDTLHQFDTAMIWNHNFAAVHAATTGGILVDIDIADDSAFGTRLQNVCVFGGTGFSRARCILPTGNTRFTGALFARMRVRSATGSADLGIMPSVGEVWLGRQRQLAYWPDMPFDDLATESEYVDFKAEGGQRTRYVKNRGRAVFEMTTRTGGGNGVDQDANLRQWWAECGYGTKPSLFYCNSSIYVLYPEAARFFMPNVGPIEREISLQFSEAAPYVSQGF